MQAPIKQNIVLVARSIGGISLNGREFLLDRNDKPIEFPNEQTAKDFLAAHDIPEDVVEFVHETREIKTPDFVLTILESSFDGETGEVIAVKYGEGGYYATRYGRQSREWLTQMNARINVDPYLAQAYSTCSVMERWEPLGDIYNRLRAGGA